MQSNCKVPGCSENHARHYCRNCGNSDSDHFGRQCPAVLSRPPPVPTFVSPPQVPTRLGCRVQGCTDMHTKHYCKACQDSDADHRSSQCNANLKPAAPSCPTLKKTGCRAAGCTNPHTTHLCSVCKDVDADHLSSNCPRKVSSRCKVQGCALTHAQHYCKVCGNTDADHHSSQCTSKPAAAVKAPGCRVTGCTDTHLKHFCKFCKNTDSDHFSNGCTQKMSASAACTSLAVQQYPSNWTAFNDQTAFVLIQLATNTTEYTQVSQQFALTSSGTQIKTISRVQNKNLYNEYQLYRATLVAELGENAVNEKKLFHGTAADVVDNICTDGFDWRVCGKNGTALGNGSYFARDSSYSLGYSQPNSSGVRKMFLARVLVGRCSQGSSSMVKAPQGSHTVVNNVSSPSIFVVFFIKQAYPEYVITF